jgi:hypothetical protein
MESVIDALVSPEQGAELELVRKPPPSKRFLAFKLFGASIVAGVLTVCLLALRWGPGGTVGAAGFGLAALLALAGAGSAIVSIATGLGTLTLGHLLLLFTALVSNGAMALFGAGMALFSLGDFRRGRQVRRFGRVLLPPLERATSWASAGKALEVPAQLRGPLAQQWRENGRTEHASVAAFARHTLDLMALGAPPRLVRAAQQDALDEIRHTELCFSLARDLDGHAVGPGPFSVPSHEPFARSRTLALSQLAVDSLVDGALHEGVSARVIAQLARRTELLPVRAVLKELAADEGRHAAHGWEVVEWCVHEGGRPVIDALHGAVRALPAEMRSPLPPPAHDGGWERYGIHGHALEAAEYAKARADIARRVAQLAPAQAA